VHFYWLQYGRSGDRIPVQARFFEHVQTGPRAHPAYCKMGTGSFPGVKQPGRGADYPLLLVLRSRKNRAIPLPLSEPSGLLQGTFTFYRRIFWFYCVKVNISLSSPNKHSTCSSCKLNNATLSK
jgi:hypothetical protein